MPRKITKESSGEAKAAPEKEAAKPAKKTTSARKTAPPSAPRRPLRSKKPSQAVSTEVTTAAPNTGDGSAEQSRSAATTPKPITVANQWRRMDLHMHTPASHDYEEPERLYIDILRQAERRGLDIIAFTDHNTAYGFRNMHREVGELELLERYERINAVELGRLNEYRRLLKKILVLPGFEFTATFGFHILGIFPPEMPLRDIDFILMQLRVPSKVVEQGLTEAGATSDVLTAYRLIAESGGIAIAPHANSSNGVFMRGMNIGGQTRIAYTQDSNLSAIELTDLAKGRRSMASWFNGYKPEYSRKMHVIQSSDAHRITVSPSDPKRLGMGDRVSEVYLPEVSFNTLKELFQSQEFDRIRHPEGILEVPTDMLREAREKGNSLTQVFHPLLPKRGDKFTQLMTDIVGLANAEGGNLYIGCDGGLTKHAAGVANIVELSSELATTIKARIAPELNVTIELQRTDDVDVLRVVVPIGPNAPYTLDGNVYHVRSETETRLAVRDDLIKLVKRTIEFEAEASRVAKVAQDAKPTSHTPRHQSTTPHHRQQSANQATSGQPQAQRPQQQAPAQPLANGQRPETNGADANGADSERRSRSYNGQTQGRPLQRSRQQGQNQPQASRTQPASNQPASNRQQPSQPEGSQVQDEITNIELVQGSPKPVQVPIEPQAEGSPRSGVEILSFEERDGVRYYTVRDLRNKSIVRNVTRKSARDLWLYALMQHAGDVYDASTFSWAEERSVLSRSQRAGKTRFDVALRDANGKVHIFYGVSDDGMDNSWRDLIQATMPAVVDEPEVAATDNQQNDSADTTSDEGLPEEVGTEVQRVAESDNLSDNALVSDSQSL